VPSPPSGSSASEANREKKAFSHDPTSFDAKCWVRFGQSDRIFPTRATLTPSPTHSCLFFLACCCVVIRYIPPRHGLLSSLPTSTQSGSADDEVSTKHYNTMKMALPRYDEEDNSHTFEFAEPQLVWRHREDESGGDLIREG